jgi:hypothetical protein
MPRKEGMLPEESRMPRKEGMLPEKALLSEEGLSPARASVRRPVGITYPTGCFFYALITNNNEILPKR